jgi:DNA-binding response OmpR family regulator
MRRPVIGIIEDDAVLQQLLHELLLAEGYETVGWNRGEGAYEFLRRVQPDLVILDLWLEHPDAGSMVLGLLMVDPATQHTPVIVCSAHQQLLRAQATHLHAQGYVLLEQPFAMEDLLAQVRAALNRPDARQVGSG